MNEKNAYLEEYRVLSPKERNMEYARFWGTLPFNAYRDVLKKAEYEDLDPVVRPLDAYFDDPWEIRKRRETSEGLQHMLNKLNTLLSLAPITPSFRNFIASGYKKSYVKGVEQGSEVTYIVDGVDTLLWTLDKEYPEHNGLFDDKRVVELERRGYRQVLRTHAFIEQVIRLYQDESGTQPIDPDVYHKKYGDSKEERVLKQWRREFMEKYQDEP